MNILIMADYRTPNSGNFIASLLELAERMRKLKHGIFFVFPDNGKGGHSWSKWLEDNGFFVFLLDEHSSEEECLTGIRQIVLDCKINLIHIHFGFCQRILRKNIKALGNVKLLIHDHMGYSPEASMWKQRIRTLAVSAMYRKKSIGVASVWEKKDDDYRLCGTKLHWYVPNGLSLRRNVSEEMTREECRKMLGIKGTDKLCLLLGWDVYRKGVDVAVNAVASCRVKNPSYHLGLVGFGVNPPAKVMEWIQNKTGIDPHSDWIHFYPSVEDIFAYYRAADVFLSASRAEGFPYAVMEAISQETAIVVSDINATVWAHEYDKSVKYPVEDYTACAAAIERAVQICGKSQNANTLLDRYSIDHWCTRVMSIYQEMLSC